MKIPKIFYIVPSIMVLIFFTNAYANDKKSDLDLVKSFVATVHKENPTIEDYQYFFGYTDIEEMQWQWKDCQETQGKKNSDGKKSCYSVTARKWLLKNRSSSSYFNWLKSIVPDGIAKNIKTEKSVYKNLKGSLIEVKISGVKLSFWRPTKNSEILGNLNLIMINNMPVSVLARFSGASSYWESKGRKGLVQPLSEKERAKKEQKLKEICDKSPACVKREKEKAFLKKRSDLYQELGRKVKKWCKEDRSACDGYRKDKLLFEKQSIEIRSECENSMEKCVSSMSSGYKKDLELLGSFCKNERALCDQIIAVDKEHYSKKVTWCNSQKEVCDKKYSRYERVMHKILSGKK
ncbi:MAG: hypothetical protein OEZ68_00640 [Gammaproteobacteria bacterium]|nr:hypothetical protein [Gammaproteobacteria bacterium]MDH5799285.1 hypothetical protein [Gammaproteobacteria bacterium]